LYGSSLASASPPDGGWGGAPKEKGRTLTAGQSPRLTSSGEAEATAHLVGLIGGYRIISQPTFLRHFTARFEPVEQLAQPETSWSFSREHIHT